MTSTQISQEEWQELTNETLIKNNSSFANFYNINSHFLQNDWKTSEHKFIAYCGSIQHRLLMVEYSRNKLYELFNSISKQQLDTSDENTKNKFLFNYYYNSYVINFNGIIDNTAWFLNYFYKIGLNERDKNKRKLCKLFDPRFLEYNNQSNCGLVDKINAIRSEKAFRDWFSQLIRLDRHPSIHNLLPKISVLISEKTGDICFKITTQLGTKFVETDYMQQDKLNQQYLHTILDIVFSTL